MPGITYLINIQVYDKSIESMKIDYNDIVYR